MKRNLRLTSVGPRMAAQVFVSLILAVASQLVAAQTLQYSEVAGTLPDLTPYRMRLPANWNGTLINDLDYASGANSASKLQLLHSGYALSGTGRAPWRAAHYDPAREAENLMTVLDLFQANFGKPRRIIQFGCSGGGNTALSIAERYPDRVDGAIATNAYTAIQAANVWLDLLYTLRALLAPGSDLPVTAPADVNAAITAWRVVLDVAQQTPDGRARIALATALAQYPTWTQVGTSEPDVHDVIASQRAMYDTARYAIAFILTNRSLFELTAGGNPSWNTAVDYKKFYENADSDQQWVIRKLYHDAGLDLGVDLDQINQSPRIPGDPAAVAFWRVWPRTHNGTPGVPTLRWHTLGDPNLPPASMQGYEARVRMEGLNDLYEQAFVHAAGHCTENVSEIAAAVETMMYRLDTGHWRNSTEPNVMNGVADSFAIDIPRFTKHELRPFNRSFYPDSAYPGDP